MRLLANVLMVLTLVTLANGAIAFFYRYNFITQERYGPSLEPIYIIGAGIALGIVALALNTRLGHGRPRGDRACAKCGYDLTGNTSGTCPECGTTAVVRDVTDGAYFSRCTTWHWVDEKILVIDPNAPRVITMEPWAEIVFVAAQGETTVGNFVSNLENQFEGDAPAGLRSQTHEIIGALVHKGVVRLHNAPESLPPEYAAANATGLPEQMISGAKPDGAPGRHAKN